MAKQKHFLVADTETTGIGDKAIVYDVAYTIATRTKTKIERSFLVREILCDPNTMLGAIDDKHWRQSFGGKIFSHYIPALNDGRLKIHSWNDIVETIRDDIKTYNVSVFAAYNLGFDMRALAKTNKKINGGRKILEGKITLLDLWTFACVTVLNTKLYHDIARREGIEKGFITPADNVRTTAEKTYAYLTGRLDFIESHTALEDAQIETEILQRLLAKKKTIPYDVMDVVPWRLAQAFGTRGLPQQYDKDLFSK